MIQKESKKNQQTEKWTNDKQGVYKNGDVNNLNM